MDNWNAFSFFIFSFSSFNWSILVVFLPCFDLACCSSIGVFILLYNSTRDWIRESVLYIFILGYFSCNNKLWVFFPEKEGPMKHIFIGIWSKVNLTSFISSKIWLSMNSSLLCNKRLFWLLLFSLLLGFSLLFKLRLLFSWFPPDFIIMLCSSEGSISFFVSSLITSLSLFSFISSFIWRFKLFLLLFISFSFLSYFILIKNSIISPT